MQTEDNTRSMAHVERITEIKPIEGADKICAYKVLGWWVVDGIGKYQVGDLAVYCETDSWISLEIAPFLQKGSTVKTYKSVDGNKLKTIKLKGQLSQGLLLPLRYDGHDMRYFIDRTDGAIREVEEGDDVTDFLGIQKWEAPEGNAQLAGQSRGNFPSEFPKTDQERIQNIRKKDFEEWQAKGYTFEVTEKLEGSSMTAFLIGDTFGVCSRNINLKDEEGNAFWDAAKKYKLEDKMKFLMESFSDVCIAFQGELVGPGIQGNIYKLQEHRFYIFDMLQRNQDYCPATHRQEIAGKLSILHSPVIETVLEIAKYSVDDLLAMADGDSMLAAGVAREGLVFKCNEDPSISFKVVSNAYLLKQKD